MAQMRFQVTPVVTDNLQEAETAFVYLLRTTGHIKHSVASPIEKAIQMWMPNLRCAFVSHAQRGTDLLNVMHIL